MSERINMQGERVSLNQKRGVQEATVKALRDKLRGLLSVILEPGELDREAILNVAYALHGELGELEGINRKLFILNRELGD